jgi:hypothetical protein
MSEVRRKKQVVLQADEGVNRMSKLNVFDSLVRAILKNNKHETVADFEYAP